MPTTALEPIAPDTCPDCGGEGALHLERWHQPALIRHAGYGATQRTTTRRCRQCGWAITTETIDTHPTRR